MCLLYLVRDFALLTSRFCSTWYEISEFQDINYPTFCANHSYLKAFQIPNLNAKIVKSV